VASFRIPKGLHRLNVRRDGGPWMAPGGTTRSADDYDGEVGVFILPYEPRGQLDRFGTASKCQHRPDAERWSIANTLMLQRHPMTAATRGAGRCRARQQKPETRLQFNAVPTYSRGASSLTAAENCANRQRH